MAKGIFTGVSGIARKANRIYVGVNGIARNVKKVYVGVNGVARLAWEDFPEHHWYYKGRWNTEKFGTLFGLTSTNEDADAMHWPVFNATNIEFKMYYQNTVFGSGFGGIFNGNNYSYTKINVVWERPGTGTSTASIRVGRGGTSGRIFPPSTGITVGTGTSGTHTYTPTSGIGGGSTLLYVSFSAGATYNSSPVYVTEIYYS